ncbi:hypothetical protein B0J17DRAFT_718360 [Rhizoctonia solani]|nr:hypothetical protein B0J17DRAFT_718360 [Rhizoctonia solani]
MASTPTKQPALKVFGIPELAHAICAGNRRRDNASLMQTRRLFFCSLLPFVWDEVDEPDRLVSMIPGGGVVAGDPDLPLLLVMRLPQSLDLSRLNIYAPHIKRLIISNIHVDEYENWGIFLTCTQHIDLLPNLDTLYLPVPEGGYHPGDAERIEDSVNWIHAFLSASLKTLVLAPLEGTAAGYYTQMSTPSFIEHIAYRNQAGRSRP